jgi:hypothetical protein
MGYSYVKKQQIMDKESALRFAKGNGAVTDLADLLDKYYVKAFQTFNVEGGEQCSSNKARSIEDAYLLAKTYFPEITYAQVAQATRALWKDVLKHGFCGTVERTVHNKAYADVGKENILEALKAKNIENIPTSLPKAHRNNGKNKTKKRSS